MEPFLSEEYLLVIVVFWNEAIITELLMATMEETIGMFVIPFSVRVAMYRGESLYLGSGKPTDRCECDRDNQRHGRSVTSREQKKPPILHLHNAYRESSATPIIRFQ